MPNFFLIVAGMALGYTIAFAGRWTWKPQGRDQLVLTFLGYMFGAALPWITVMPVIATVGSVILFILVIVWRKRHPVVDDSLVR